MSDSENSGSDTGRNATGGELHIATGGDERNAAGGESSGAENRPQVQVSEPRRLQAEATANRAPRSYVYLPRERQIQNFSGDYSKDGRNVEEFIEEVERVLRTREQTLEERFDFVISLLRGPALEEVRMCVGNNARQTQDVFKCLSEAFGEKRSATQLLQSFYHRKQAEGEKLSDYSHALSHLLTAAVKQSPGLVPNERILLRDQFVEGLQDALLKRELRKLVREKPQWGIKDVRKEAELWAVEESTTATKMVKPRVSEVTNHTQCSAVSIGQNKSTTLDEVLEVVSRQEKRLVEQDTAIAELTKAIKELTVSRTQTYRTPGRRPRMQPRFTDDGQPICFKCNGIGHLAKECTQRLAGQPQIPHQEN